MQLQPNYIIDNHNHKIAVQLDIQTYKKITETLENFALFKFMEENQDDEKLSLSDAKQYYQTLKENEN
jgi:hypothetical protein